MGFHGISCDFMGFHGISRDFMGLHGSSWDFMGYHVISCDFLLQFLFFFNISCFLVYIFQKLYGPCRLHKKKLLLESQGSPAQTLPLPKLYGLSSPEKIHKNPRALQPKPIPFQNSMGSPAQTHPLAKLYGLSSPQKIHKNTTGLQSKLFP